MKCPSPLAHLFAQTKLFTDTQTYVLVHLPRMQTQSAVRMFANTLTHFGAVIQDKDEITWIVPQMLWQAYSPKLVGAIVSSSYRLITLDVVLDLDVIGYLAVLFYHRKKPSFLLFKVHFEALCKLPTSEKPGF